MTAVTLRKVRSKSRQLVKRGIRSTGPVRSALGNRLRRIPLPESTRVAISTALLRRPWALNVPVDRLLLGAQNARHHSAADFAAQTGDMLWPSTPVADGPHVALLRRAVEGPMTDDEILASPYGEMAMACVRGHGRYFDAFDKAGVVAGARAFIGGATRPAGTAPILVAPVKGSDYFQVLDGHHRVARAIVAGEPTVRVTAKWFAVTTPLQDHLTTMSWLDGDRQLYQPLSAPELRQSWPTVRRCTDRRDKMLEFLGDSDESYLDVASCYGWFVAELAKHGYETNGMERDPLAVPLGKAAYGLPDGAIQVGDCVELLRSAGRTWDVVSCFSLLHHFVLGRGSVNEVELVKLLDSVTGRVLFLDTGQDHEEWFAESLKGWDTEHVAAFLREHTTFDEIIDLGPDVDAVPPHDRNYGRHLFACVRTGAR